MSDPVGEKIPLSVFARRSVVKRVSWVLACFAIASGAFGEPLAASGGVRDAAAIARSATSNMAVELQSHRSNVATAASGGTCTSPDRSGSALAIPKVANTKTARHAKYKFTFEYPSDWFDGTDMSAVPAGGVIDEATLREARLKPSDTLHNVNVASKSDYPMMTVYRFAGVKDNAGAVAARMATFLKARGVKTGVLLSWCLDGASAKGFLAVAPGGTLQQSWFVVHGGALYYVFFLGKTDGTKRSQDELMLGFGSIRATWKWL